VPTFQILNAEWRATVLGVGAFVFVIMVAMFGTTTRAAMLVGKGLLNTKVYMCKTTFSLPYILGFVTYFTAFVFSMFLWQLTAVRNCKCLPPEQDPDDFHIEHPGSEVDCVWTRGSLVLVEIAVGLPIVIVIGARFFNRWISNDYEIMPSWDDPALRCEGGIPDLEDDDDDDKKNDGSGNPQASEQAGSVPKFGLGTGTFTLPPLKKSTHGEFCCFCFCGRVVARCQCVVKQRGLIFILFRCCFFKNINISPGSFSFFPP
jgi:hypothetical protein